MKSEKKIKIDVVYLLFYGGLFYAGVLVLWVMFFGTVYPFYYDFLVIFLVVLEGFWMV